MSFYGTSSSSSVHSSANLLTFFGGDDTAPEELELFPNAELEPVPGESSLRALLTPRFSLTKLSSKCSKSLKGPVSVVLTFSVNSELTFDTGEPTGRPSEAAIPEAR